MNIYFARHGQSEANVLRVISNRGLVHPLTELGRAQAAALAESLHGRPIVRIYTSPLLRARQTAEIVASALGVPVEEADALREPDCGEAEGRDDAEAWALNAGCWTAWRAGQHDHRVPGGESLLDIRARFVPFVERLAAAPQSGDLLLIGHGMLYHTLLPLVLTNVDHAFGDAHAIPNTGFIVAEATPAGLVCREWCGVAP